MRRARSSNVLLIEGEEVFFYGNSRIAYGGDRIKQVRCAAEFVVKDGTGQVVAGVRATAQKEAAAHALIRVVDRDVLAGYFGVADEISGRRQSAKTATDNVRLHLRPQVWRSSRPATAQAPSRERGNEATRFQRVLARRPATDVHSILVF
jgi:hypothetical protein